MFQAAFGCFRLPERAGWPHSHFGFVRREGFPFVAGGAVPEENLRFEIAVAAAVHQAFLDLAVDHVADHFGVCFPRRMQRGEAHAQQAVNAVEVGAGAHQFEHGLVGALFAVEQQRFFVDQLGQIELGKGFHVADQDVQPFGGLALGVESVVQAL